MNTAPSKGVKRILRAANGLHVAIYHRSRGKFANQVANMPVLLITTYGRKTGQPKTNPVVYLQDGQDFLVSATNGGAAFHPDWYLNLRARPEARVEIGDRAFDVQATIVENEDRARLYERFKAASGNFAKYEQKTSRVIPVIWLRPRQQK